MVLTEGLGLKMNMGGLGKAMAKLARVKTHLPGMGAARNDLIERALLEVCRMMRVIDYQAMAGDGQQRIAGHLHRPGAARDREPMSQQLFRVEIAAKAPTIAIDANQQSRVEGDAGETMFNFTVVRTGDLIGDVRAHRGKCWLAILRQRILSAVRSRLAPSRSILATAPSSSTLRSPATRCLKRTRRSSSNCRTR